MKTQQHRSKYIKNTTDMDQNLAEKDGIITKKIKRYSKKVDYLMFKIKNLNNWLCTLFYLINFILRSEFDTNRKTHLSFNTLIFISKVIVSFFSIMYRII